MKRLLLSIVILIFISAFTTLAQQELYGWGKNEHGQLGDGTTTDKLAPVPVLGEFASVSCGAYHTLALKDDGTLWSWGYNSYGQLGIGSTTNQSSPVKVGSGTNWKSVSCGAYHTLAIKTDGTMWAWGYDGNGLGLLGIGGTTNQSSPVKVGSATNWKSVSCGKYHTLAIKTDGTLWSWGYNNYGQLGIGSTDNQSSPVQVGSSTNWKSVSCGAYHTLAIQTDGTLWAWGNNYYGELGIGSTSDQSNPVQVGSGTNWKLVSCGDYHTLAIQTDGTMWAWGYNGIGQLGIGSTANQSSPLHVSSESSWKLVSCGAYHTLAIKNDGTLWSCGTNNYGQLGIGNKTAKSSFVQLDSRTNWALVAGGKEYSLALLNVNTVNSPNMSDLVLWLNGQDKDADGEKDSPIAPDSFFDVWTDVTFPKENATQTDENKQPKQVADKFGVGITGIEFANDYSSSGYANSDIMTSPYNAEITTATEDQWSPDNSPKTLIVVFKTGSSVDADGDPEPYYSDGRQVIFEAGGPLSGYNIYIINGKLAFGMWNRFQQKFMVYDPPMDNSIYPLDVNSVYIAQLEYDGTDFQATVSKSGGDMLVQSDQIPFAGISKDGEDHTGVGGAARTCFHDYNTGETYSCTFNGAIGDVILYNSAFDQATGQEVYDFLSDRYRLGTVTYPAPASGKISYGDWKVYEFEDAAPGDVMLSLAYPNPFDSKTNIGVNLPEDMNVEIELCDINGKVVKNIYSGNIGNGFHNFEVDGSSLNSGVYIFRISSESFTKSCRLILNK